MYEAYGPGPFKRQFEKLINPIFEGSQASAGDLAKDIVIIRENLDSIREYLQSQKSPTSSPKKMSDGTEKKLAKMLRLLETRHVELVSDQCPASLVTPKRYSRRS